MNDRQPSFRAALPHQRVRDDITDPWDHDSVPPRQQGPNDEKREGGAPQTRTHQLDNTSTEPPAPTKPTPAAEDEEEEEEERTHALRSSIRGNTSGVSISRTPSSSATERQEHNDPARTEHPEDPSTNLGDTTTDGFSDPGLGDDGNTGGSHRTSFTTSVASYFSRLVEENDRLYPNYGKYEYGLPVDDPERERMLVQHRKFSLVLEGRQFLSPIVEYPQKILDLITGTGLWAVDVADQFPTATVTGVDVADIQPRYLPPNCVIEILDVEEPWRLKKDSFDFIHMRDPLFVVRDWEKLVNQCFEHLKPGGWCELACTYLAPASDSGRMPDSSEFRLVCEKLVEASKVFRAPADCPLRFVDQLQQAGFVHVTQREFRIPSCPWPDEERQREIGRLEAANLHTAASSFGLRLFERAFGWTRAEIEVAMVGFRRDSANPSYRQYCPQ